MNIPIYVKIANAIKEKIDLEMYKPNEPVPSEAALCEAYAVSRLTVRKSLELLVREGLVYLVQGKGHFVRKNNGSVYTLDFNEVGFDTVNIDSIRIVDVDVIESTKELVYTLQIHPNTRVLRIRRVLYANGLPVGYKLDSENSLCEAYNVSKVTLRKALSNLIEAHYIESRPRVGYFVETAKPGVYKLSYSLGNILNTPVLGEEMVSAGFKNNTGVNEFRMEKRYFNDDEEWVAFEEIRIVSKHALPEKRKTAEGKDYFANYAASILALAEKKKMEIEIIKGPDTLCDALEILWGEVLLKVQEKYFDEYDKQFAEVLLYIPSEYAMVQASNKKEEPHV